MKDSPAFQDDLMFAVNESDLRVVGTIPRASAEKLIDEYGVLRVVDETGRNRGIRLDELRKGPKWMKSTFMKAIRVRGESDPIMPLLRSIPGWCEQ